ncbi:MAG: Ku protein [Oceanicaulis sp.]
MAAPRTFWTGYLRLSLVSIDVALYSATNTAGRISLRQIHKPSGKRIRYKKVPEGSDEEADPDDIVKGYEARKGSFVVLEPDELDQIKLETKDAIRIVSFVDQTEIDPRFFEKPYYVAPRGGSSAEGFVVIREALRRHKKTAIGQMVMRGRENLVAIRPCGKGLLLETLRYADEVRKSEAVFEDIAEPDLDEEMMELAESLIEKKSEPFEPEKFEDKYETALRELIEEKAEGEEIVSAGEDKPKGGQVIDLMEALKKSVAEEKAGGSSAKSGGSKRSAASKSKSASTKKSSGSSSSSSSRKKKAG